MLKVGIVRRIWTGGEVIVRADYVIVWTGHARLQAQVVLIWDA